METYSVTMAAKSGINHPFVQDNQSCSVAVGTVRGIHFQTPPHAQAKLVRCVSGGIMDYAVDLRRASPTFGAWIGVELTQDNGLQLYIPVGYGHAFVTLQPNTEVAYKVSDIYAPQCDGGVRWNDPDIGIDWPLPAPGAVLSEKDRILPPLRAFESPFDYNGWPLEAVAGSITRAS